MFVPRSLLRQLYVKGSLENVDLDGDGEPEGIRFKLKNTLASGSVAGSLRVVVDDEEVDPSKIILEFKGEELRASEAAGRVLYVGIGDEITITIELGHGLPPGEHKVELELTTREFGPIGFDFTDVVR